MNLLLKTVFACSIFLVFSCNDNRHEKIVVDFNSPTHDSVSISFHEDEAIHVAIASISSPRESYKYYNDLLQHISSKIDIPIHSIQKQSYEEINHLLKEGAVDFAFVCSGAYIESKDLGEVEILVAPVINNTTHYHAYLITQPDNPAVNLSDLRGNSFAFSDPLSHTAHNYPLARLKELNEDPNTFFSSTVFSFGHDLSIEMVNKGLIDAAFVHGLIYDYMRRFSPQKIGNTKIIEVSEPFGIPPIVVPSSLDKKRMELYRSIFLNLHNEKVGKDILFRLNIDKYTEVDDSIYDGVRETKNAIRNEND